MIGDAGQRIGEPGLWIDAVELGGFNQRVGNGSRFATVVGSHEQVVFAPDSNGAHATFGCVVVDAQAAIVQIGPCSFEARHAITDGTGQD